MSKAYTDWLKQTIAEMQEYAEMFPGDIDGDHGRVLKALRIALVSLEAEPVALRDERSGSGGISKKPGFNDLPHGTPLYAAPQFSTEKNHEHYYHRTPDKNPL